MTNTLKKFRLLIYTYGIFGCFFGYVTFWPFKKRMFSLRGRGSDPLLKLTWGSPGLCIVFSWSKSTSTASTNSSEMAWSKASFVSTLCSINNSTISRFSLSMAIKSAERPNGSTQFIFIKSVSWAFCNVLQKKNK